MIYLDTSVVVALLVPEPKTADVKAWFADLSSIPASGDWLLSEFASAVSIKMRRGELTERNAKVVHKEFGLLVAGELRLIPVSRAAFTESASLAKQYKGGLRAGDALHLAVALDAGIKALATADEVLARNATAKGLSVTRF